MFLRNDAKFGEVELVNADIGSNLETIGSIFTGKFNANSLKVGGSVFLRNVAKIDEVELIGAHIDGNLEATSSTFTGKINAYNLKIGGSIFLRDSQFKELNFASAKIAGPLELQRSKYWGKVDLSETAMGPIIFGYPGSSEKGITWGANASLILRNAQSKSLQARMDSSKNQNNWTRDDGSRLPLDLTGFRYSQLVALGATDGHGLAQADIEAIIKWIDNSGSSDVKGYRPDPYYAMETTLRNMGAEAAATQVAYARLTHRADTRVTANFWSEPDDWIWQYANVFFDRFLQFTVGFGVYPAWAFIWFVVLVLVGAGLARSFSKLTPDAPASLSLGDSIFYSLENSIPLVPTSQHYAALDHKKNYVRLFFGWQKIFGFVLATVLIGVLSFGV